MVGLNDPNLVEKNGGIIYPLFDGSIFLRADILLIARLFPRYCEAPKNTTQLVKYPHVFCIKPSNKVNQPYLNK